MSNEDSKVTEILNMAKKDRKHNLFVYEYYKQMLYGLPIGSDEYDRAIRKLVNILRV